MEPPPPPPPIFFFFFFLLLLLPLKYNGVCCEFVHRVCCDEFWSTTSWGVYYIASGDQARFECGILPRVACIDDVCDLLSARCLQAQLPVSTQTADQSLWKSEKEKRTFHYWHVWTGSCVTLRYNSRFVYMYTYMSWDDNESFWTVLRIYIIIIMAYMKTTLRGLFTLIIWCVTLLTSRFKWTIMFTERIWRFFNFFCARLLSWK